MDSFRHRVKNWFGKQIIDCTTTYNSSIPVWCKILDAELYPVGLGSPRVGDAGTDLKCAETVEIPPRVTALIPLGIAMHTGDPNVVGLLFPRSSFSKLGLTVPNSVGVIDSGYQGELKIAVRNLNDTPVTVTKGDRICQIVYLHTYTPELVQVTDFEKSERGTGGFGSTGK
jgi:dUTP pyrophosphatase